MIPIFPKPKQIIYGTKQFHKTQESIVYLHEPERKEEGYELQLKDGIITLRFGGGRGAFYGEKTLNQILSQEDILELTILDEPSIEKRGFLLDISRNKIPSMASLKNIIHILSDLKYNQLQLYIEGYPYAYEGYEAYWKEETPLSAADLQELDCYCRQHFIDLIPCQNSLGHMGAWLAHDEFKQLAEVDRVVEFLGNQIPPMTLDPTNPKSIQFISSLTSDLYANFSSSLCNVCLDEPFEIGMGRSKEEVEHRGKGTVFLAYVLQIYELTKSLGKRMMMWGDFVADHPELLAKLPKDIIIIQWGYEARHPDQEKVKALADSHHEFYLCAGTSTWSSFSGRTAVMLENVKNTIACAHQYHAHGVMLADWGDLGHVQYEPISYQAMSLFGALAWNPEDFEMEELCTWINTFIYHDQANVLAQFALELGTYSRFLAMPKTGRTELSIFFYYGGLLMQEYLDMFRQYRLVSKKLANPDQTISLSDIVIDRGINDYQSATTWLCEMKQRLNQVRVTSDKGYLYFGEYQNTLQLITFLIHMLEYCEKIEQGVIQKEDNINFKQYALPEWELILRQHERLWRARNRESGLRRSMKDFYRIKKTIEEIEG